MRNQNESQAKFEKSFINQIGTQNPWQDLWAVRAMG